MQRFLYALALWLPVVCSAQLTGQYSSTFTTNFPLWDFSGTYAFSEGGLEVMNTLVHAPNGSLTGTGSAHLNSGSTNILGDLDTKGRVNGRNTGRVTIAAAGKGEFSGSITKLQVSGPLSGNLALVLDAGDRVVSGTESVSLCVKRYGCKTISTNVSFALPDEMTGAWTLALDITTTNKVVRGTATVELSNGRTLSFRARGRYRPATGLTVLTLSGTGNAFGSNLPLTLDSTGVIQKLRGKLLGQTLVYPVAN